MTDEKLSDLEAFAHAAINKMSESVVWSALIGCMHRDGYIERAVDYIESMPPETALAMIAEIRRLRLVEPSTEEAGALADYHDFQESAADSIGEPEILGDCVEHHRRRREFWSSVAKEAK